MTSEDGYILGLQRIPTGRSGEKADKPPVLLQHGLFVVNNIPLLHIYSFYIYMRVCLVYECCTKRSSFCV